MLTHRWGISLLLVLLGLSVVNAQVVVPWGVFDKQPISPVARPLDMLASPNGFICSDNVMQYTDMIHPGEPEQMAVWSIRSQESQTKARRWAVMRLALPTEVATQIVGVRVTLQVDAVTTVQWRMHTDGTNFYRTKVIGRNSHELAVGRQSFDLIWAQAGVRNLPPVTGFELARHDQIGDLGLIRFDLIFKDESSAKNYQKREAQQLASLQKTMRQWLSDRGVDLRSLENSKTSEQLEMAAWQGVQLLAIIEQLHHAGGLSHDVSKLNTLEKQRQILVDHLMAGQDIAKQLTALQSQIDTWVNDVLGQKTTDEQRWFIGDDQRFHRPTGEPFRMYGPHFFRSMFVPADPSRMWRTWDIRYLAGMGFNGLRLHIRWCNLEPTQGTFDTVYLNMLKAIMREANRYGMAVSVDMHWPFPDWFVKGKPGMETTSQSMIHLAHNVYHWPEALVDAWKRLAVEFADVPNILAFEVPANETNVGRGPGGLRDYPNLVHQWNQWLKQSYKTRDELSLAWSGASDDMAVYRLREDESWDNDSIAPLGFQTPVPTDVNTNYQNNPRLWDHMRFTAAMQERLTTQIMHAIRQSIPNAVGMSQRTIGDMYDVSPVPLSYYAINTLFGEHVNIGTHYGMGGSTAIEAASLNLASYDSERQMENAQETVRRQVELGLGFCPFAFHARGGGGMLFADDDWHMKSQTAYLPGMSQWIRTYWPKPAGGPCVAVISNTRLGAINTESTSELVEMLQKRGLHVKLFEGLKIVQQPQLLADCKAVITASSYMDVNLLQILKTKYTGRVLLYGRLDADALCRNPQLGLPLSLVQEKVILKTTEFSALSGDELGQLDLTGSWDWQYLGQMPDKPESLPVPTISQGKDWRSITIPGKLGEMGLLGSSKYYMGDSWCLREVFIPEHWRGRSLMFEAGAMDDYDWTFFNGKLIGSTTKSRHHYWLAARQYPIPNEIIKWGKINIIAVRLRNDFQDGGIWKGPVQITSNQRLDVLWDQSNAPSDKVQLTNAAPVLLAGQVIPGTRMLATIKVPGNHAPVAAMLQQDRWYWWIGSNDWATDDQVQATVLNRFLQKIMP